MRQGMPIAECLALSGSASAQAGSNTHRHKRHRSNLAVGFLRAGGQSLMKLDSFRLRIWGSGGSNPFRRAITRRVTTTLAPHPS